MFPADDGLQMVQVISHHLDGRWLAFVDDKVGCKVNVDDTVDLTLFEPNFAKDAKPAKKTRTPFNSRFKKTKTRKKERTKLIGNVSLDVNKLAGRRVRPDHWRSR